MALANRPRVNVTKKKTLSSPRAVGSFNVDLGCDFMAPQDFVTLSLFPLLKKRQLPFPSMFTLVLEPNPTGKTLE